MHFKKTKMLTFLFCQMPMQGKRAKVNRTKILQKFLNFTILFTYSNWQQKVKWFGRLKCENQARGS
jgi:hypothetical protein